MLLHYLLSLVLLFSSTTAWQWKFSVKSYYVDDTCYWRIPEFDLVMMEVQQMAKRAKQRTSAAYSGNDPDWARAFKFVFKTDVRDETPYPPDDQQAYQFPSMDRWKLARQHVRDNLAIVADNWVRAPREQADVRIYCDNMARWKERTSGDGSPIWKDEQNFLLALTTCSYPDESYAVTNQDTYNPIDGSPTDNNPIRSTITLCDPIFDPDDGYTLLLKKQPLDLKLDHHYKLVRDMHIVSTTLFHEWLHTSRFGWDDHYNANGDVGLAHIMSTTTEEALEDPESYAFLGFLALLADRRPVLERGQPPSDRGGYSIRRDIEDLPPDSDEIKYGRILKAYRDLSGSYMSYGAY